jgi:hypothetical protein
MLTAQKPDNEQSRLASLRALDALDSAPEAQFNALVRAAAFVAGTPISLLSLIDTGRQWFKANPGQRVLRAHHPPGGCVGDSGRDA